MPAITGTNIKDIEKTSQDSACYFNIIANQKKIAQLKKLIKLVATYKVEPNLIPALPFAISCEAFRHKL